MKFHRLIPKSLSRNTRLLVGAAVGVPLALIAAFIALLVANAPSIWRPDFDYPEYPSRYYTAREAYDAALPQIPSWHEDAVVLNIFHGPSGNPAVWGIREDGRAPIWNFSVASPSAMRNTIISLIDDVAFVSGRDGHPDWPLRSYPGALPAHSIIDSDEALAIGIAAGAPRLPTTIGTGRSRLDAHGDLTGEVIPPSWVLCYGEYGREPCVFIEAVLGIVVQNDFAP